MRRRQTLLWMTLILLAGFALRLFQINAVPLRGDEAFTVLHWMREPLAQSLSGLATIDPQPPLAYALYRGFGLVIGSDERVVRLLPALVNLIGVAALYGAGRRIGGTRLGLIAAALYAASPVILWHAQDARSYGLWIALSALSLWLALRAIERDHWLDWALFVLVQIAAAYLYYLELLFLGALTVYVLLQIRRRPRLVARWFVALALIGLALAPWYLQPDLLSGGEYGGTAGRLDPALYLTWFLPSLLFGEAIPAGRELLFSAMALVTAGTGFALLWRSRREWALLLALYLLIPLAAIGVISTQLNVFVPRYVLGVATALILLSALVIERGLGARNRSPLLRLLALGLVVMLGWSLFRYYFDYAKAPDWRALAAYLAPRTTADDLLVNTSADEAFTFYTQAYGVAGELAYMPANPRQTQAEIEGRLTAAFDEERAVWLGANPPEWPNARVGDDWLAQYGLLLRDANIDGLRAQQFVADAAAEGDASSIADFGRVARLLGATVALPLEPDGSLPLTLDFEVVAASESPLKTFVHVLGPVNPATGTPLWAQDDQAPRDSLDTSVWEAGLRYRDVFRLPALDQLDPGDYAIVVGWYDPITEQRLDVNGSDSVVIARLVVDEEGELTLHMP
jgi:4-amino-4-deoxy-L-arabinose transferase-like glycosyltransferase